MVFKKFLINPHDQLHMPHQIALVCEVLPQPWVTKFKRDFNRYITTLSRISSSIFLGRMFANPPNKIHQMAVKFPLKA